MGEPYQKTVRLFSDRAHYSPADRGELSDILRPQWKERPMTPIQLEQQYGLHPDDFALADDLRCCDMAVLPMTWNHYIRLGKLAQAQRFVEAARMHSRPILSYVSGDEGVRVPSEFSDVWTVRASGFRSRRNSRQIAQPVFFTDPVAQFPELENAEPAQLLQKPVVGFCGQSNARLHKAVIDTLRCASRNLAFHFGFRLAEPQPLYPPSLLRARALGLLAGSPCIETRFIQRLRYRGGATDPQSQRETSLDFYRNIATTHYTLCVRGGGNFSKRFYEVLAMGRVPVLLDTDCLLPLDSIIDWDSHILRVPVGSLRDLPRLVCEHFDKIGASSMSSLQRSCRSLWQESLSFSGFHRRLMEFLMPAH